MLVCFAINDSCLLCTNVAFVRLCCHMLEFKMRQVHGISVMCSPHSGPKTKISHKLGCVKNTSVQRIILRATPGRLLRVLSADMIPETTATMQTRSKLASFQKCESQPRHTSPHQPRKPGSISAMKEGLPYLSGAQQMVTLLQKKLCCVFCDLSPLCHHISLRGSA